MLHCGKGQEEAAVQNWKKMDFSGQTVPFLVTFERMKRYEGTWHSLCIPLIPGVFFVESRTGNSLQGCQAVEVGQETKAFLQTLGGSTHHIPMSKGIIQNGVTYVTEGPLVGQEARIRKIDRHRRLAKIEAPSGLVEGEAFWAGLEITSKS